MTTSNTSARTIALIALSLVVAVGCGEAPIDDVGANPYLGQETGAQAQPDPGYDFDVELDRADISLDQAIVSRGTIEALPEGDGNIADPGFDMIEALEDQAEVDAEAGMEGIDELDVAESLEDGFSDGDATGGEWKSIAKATCRVENSELAFFEVAGQLSEGLYRGAAFSCEDRDLESEVRFEGKYRAVVLGGVTSCKSYETFLSTAQRICGSEASIVSKKVFTQCADSDDETMYESGLFVCQVN